MAICAWELVNDDDGHDDDDDEDDDAAVAADVEDDERHRRQPIYTIINFQAGDGDGNDVEEERWQKGRRHDGGQWTMDADD